MGELLTAIDSTELSEWMAFYNIEPWGAEADDLRASYAVWRLAQTWGCKAALDLFVPPVDPQPQPEQSPEAMKAIFAGIAARGTRT